ncbi:MAG: hypothetical protein MZV65_17680 [Chromatiales bacterium]|nr:hypothetical protein [Chromatiales bacterium]
MVVNGCECETLPHHRRPGDDRMGRRPGARHHASRCAPAARARAVIGIEDNKPRAIAALPPAPARSMPQIAVAPVATKYPQGAERLLIKTLLGREIPSGARSWEIGVVTQNIATLAELGRLLPLAARADRARDHHQRRRRAARQLPGAVRHAAALPAANRPASARRPARSSSAGR